MARRPAAVPTQRVLTQGIADLKTRQAIDQLSSRLAQAEATSRAKDAELEQAHAALASTVKTHADSITKLTTGLNWATTLAVAAQPDTTKNTSPIGSGPRPGNPPVPTSPPANTDNGQAAAGFANPFPTGTPLPGSPITAYVAGQIVGGVANQFQANYFAGPAGSQAILDSWRECFNNRVIFHLNAAGFQTSHYPSGAAATYLILLNIPDTQGNDVQYAYKITNYDPTLTLVAEMTFVALNPGQSTTPDPGIPDSTPCP